MVGEAAGRPVAVVASPSFPFLAVAQASEPHFAYSVLQRGMDVVLALMLIVVTLPLVILAALAVAVTTRQWPVFVQRRVGWQGAEFPMLKLRSMRDGGETARGFAAKTPHDARVTAVGSVLRRTSMDELPQLLNVLAGHMTLVGPRPGLPAEVTEYRAPWLRRLSVKPGLTGLWQVSGRSSLPLHRWMALDRVYLARRSTAMDLAILVRTVAAVVSMRGAW